MAAQARDLIQHLDYEEYRNNVSSLLCRNAKLDTPYSRFSLYRQSEMMTSSLSDVCVELLWVLARQAWLVPKNGFIYLKEFVTQTEFRCRGLFFEYLRQIENTKLVSIVTLRRLFLELLSSPKNCDCSFV